MKLLAVAPVAALAFVLTFLAVRAASPVQGAGEIAWHYDGYSYSWDWRDFPRGEWAYFEITYDNGWPAFQAANGLWSPGYVHPDPPAEVGCGWQHWIVYQGSSLPLSNATYHPTLNPSASLVLARGDLYVCDSKGV